MAEGTPSPPSNDNAFTYIVQVPKDQIFLIPPKENARLVEQYQAHLTSRRKKRPLFFIFLLRFLCFFISIALPLMAAALIFIIVVRPTAPVFNLDRIVTAPSEAARCVIFMRVSNPSIGMGYFVQRGDGRGAKLSYKGRVLADGEFQELRLNAKELRRFELVLHGVRTAALEEVEESLQGLKTVAQLRLTAAAPARVEIWGLRLWRMKMRLDCDVRVKGSAKATELLSQECEVSMAFW